jgi:uncharacterized protein with HEPN domain
MKRDISLFLADVVKNMDYAERFIGSMSYDEFIADEKTVYALVRCWVIIGEAVKNVTPDIRSRKPGIPWTELAGMSEKCVQPDFNINFQYLWQAVKDDIPRIKPLVKSILEEIRIAKDKKP